MSLVFLESAVSTNSECASPSYRHGDAVAALEQTGGKGQRGNRWLTSPGMNLTMSLVVEPHTLAARDQFQLSRWAALAVTRLLDGMGIHAMIKWPNDIYVGDRKICGILIENSLRGGMLARSIVGIGLNLNQTVFDPSVPNPTSVSLLTGHNCGIEETARLLHAILMESFGMVEDMSCHPGLEERYLERLYRLGSEHGFILSDGSPTKGTITGVRSTGELRVRHIDGKEREYLFKEISYII